MAADQHNQGHSHPVNMGLGDIIRRLMHIEWQGRHTGLTPEVRSERDMLLEALNVVPVVIGFDCDGDGTVDHGVGIFAQAASTSCCRLKPPGGDNSRYTPPPPEPEGKKPTSTSRRAQEKPSTPKKGKGFLGLFSGKSEDEET